MAVVGNELAIIIRAYDQATAVLVGLKGQIAALQTQVLAVQKAWSGFALSVGGLAKTGAVAGAVVGAGLIKGLFVAADFEQAMADVGSILYDSSEDAEVFRKRMERLGDYAKLMGIETVFTAVEAAEAMYYLASAGYKEQEVIDALRPALDLAAATQSDLAFTTRSVVEAINMFGLEATDAARVSNTYAAGISKSQLEMDLLAASMVYIGPVASAMGWTIEETVGALGKLHDAGFKGSMAGTALRGMLTRLVAASGASSEILAGLANVVGADFAGEVAGAEEETEQLIAAFAKLGGVEAWVEAALAGPVELITMFEKAGPKAAEMMKILGQRAGPGTMALVSQGSDALAVLIEQIADTEKAAEMAGVQLDTFSGQWTILKASVTGVIIEAFQPLLPVLTTLVTEHVIPAVNSFAAWVKEVGGLEGVMKHLVDRFKEWMDTWTGSREATEKIIDITLKFLEIYGRLLLVIVPLMLAFKALAIVFGPIYHGVKLLIAVFGLLKGILLGTKGILLGAMGLNVAVAATGAAAATASVGMITLGGATATMTGTMAPAAVGLAGLKAGLLALLGAAGPIALVIAGIAGIAGAWKASLDAIDRLAAEHAQRAEETERKVRELAAAGDVPAQEQVLRETAQAAARWAPTSPAGRAVGDLVNAVTSASTSFVGFRRSLEQARDGAIEFGTTVDMLVIGALKELAKPANSKVPLATLAQHFDHLGVMLGTRGEELGVPFVEMQAAVGVANEAVTFFQRQIAAGKTTVSDVNAVYLSFLDRISMAALGTAATTTEATGQVQELATATAPAVEELEAIGGVLDEAVVPAMEDVAGVSEEVARETERVQTELKKLDSALVLLEAELAAIGKTAGATAATGFAEIGETIDTDVTPEIEELDKAAADLATEIGIMEGTLKDLDGALAPFGISLDQAAAKVAGLGSDIGALNAMLTDLGRNLQLPAFTLPGLQIAPPEIPGKQVGGFVGGQGSGDIIPAMLEPGEFVIPKWMMRIPWLAAIIAGIWRGGKGYQAGGDVGMGGLPLRWLDPDMMAERAAEAGAAWSAQAQKEWGKTVRDVCKQEIEPAIRAGYQDLAETSGQAIKDIDVHNIESAMEAFAAAIENVTELSVEDLTVLQGKYGSVAGSLESAVGFLNKLGVGTEDLRGQLADLREMFGDVESAAKTRLLPALEEIGKLAEIDPAAAAAALREMALEHAVVAEKAQEIQGAYEAEIRVLRMFGMETGDAERALAEFNAGMRGTTVEWLRWEEWLDQASGSAAWRWLLEKLPEDTQIAVRDFLLALDPKSVEAALSKVADAVLGSYAAGTMDVAMGLITGNWVQAAMGVADLVTTAAEEAAQKIEEAVAGVTEALRILWGHAVDLGRSFLDLIVQSEEMTEIQRSLATVQATLIGSLLGFLAPIAFILQFVLGLFEEEAEDAAAARKSLASVNIPTGYKLERAAWGVAAPGQPWREEEDDIKDRFKDLLKGVPKWLREILETFRGAIEEAVQGIRNFIQALEEVWKTITPVIIEALLPVLRYFGEALGEVAALVKATLLPALIEYLPPILTNLGKAFADLTATILSGIVAFIASVALPVLDTFAGALAAVAGWARTVLLPDLIALFAGIGNWWRTEMDPFLKATVFPKIAEWGTALYNWLKDQLFPFLENSVWPFLRDRFWPDFEKLATAFLGTLEKMWNTIEKHWPAVEDWILNKLAAFFGDLTGQLELGMVGILYETSGFWAAMDALWSSESINLWDKLKYTFFLGVDALVKNFNWLGAIVGGLIGAAFGPLGIGIGVLIGGFINLGGIATALGGVGRALWQAIVGLPAAIAGMGLALLQLPIQIIRLIGRGIEQAFRWIINGIIDLLNWALGWAGVNIPRLQRGGIVDEPTLAMLGEAGPEAVIPLDKLGALFRQAVEEVHLEISVPRAQPLAVAVAPNSRSGGDIHFHNVTFNLPNVHDPREFQDWIRFTNLRGTGRSYGTYATAGKEVG